MHQFAVADSRDEVRRWLEEFLIVQPVGRDRECLEVGCFPGQYLAVFGEYGYRLSGIDATPRTDTELKDWLRRCGYAIGDIIRGDFFAHSFDKQFDVVYSLGFIEHFTDWDDVVRRHMCLVKPGGHLVLSTPNFRGFVQYVYHWLFDRENLRHHNLEAMDPRRWSEAVKTGFRVVRSGHFGGMHFWTASCVHSRVTGKALQAIGVVETYMNRHARRSLGAYAPYCGLIARKTR